MQETQTGTVKIVECKDFNEAQTRAGQEAANTAGFPIPCVVFSQGRRSTLERLAVFFRRHALRNEIAGEKGDAR